MSVSGSSGRRTRGRDERESGRRRAVRREGGREEERKGGKGECER